MKYSSVQAIVGVLDCWDMWTIYSINVWWALSRDKINSIVTYKVALSMDIYGDIFNFIVYSVQRDKLC